MPRRIDIVIPSARSAELVRELTSIDGVYGLQVSSGGSVKPPGDVITVEATTRSLPRLMAVLDDHKIGQSADTLITTTKPLSIMASPRAPLARDRSEASWEEMDSLLADESNMSPNGLLLMALAGAVAAFGLATNALHIVIGAMIIAPGFEPLVRIAIGSVSRSTSWRYGIFDTLKGYGALVVGAVAGTLVARAVLSNAFAAKPSYDVTGLLSYWSTVTGTGVLIAIVAGAAGALLVVAARTVLTAGVMVALALVPSAAMVGVGLATWDLGLAASALLRWAVDVGLVVVSAWGLTLLQRMTLQRRRANA